MLPGFGRKALGEQLGTGCLVPENRQLMKAVELLHKGNTQPEVFAAAASEATSMAQRKRGQ